MGVDKKSIELADKIQEICVDRSYIQVCEALCILMGWVAFQMTRDGEFKIQDMITLISSTVVASWKKCERIEHVEKN